jgi:hypothetical protein
VTPNYEQVLSQALALPAAERLRLIGELANHLAQSKVSTQEIEPTHRIEAAQQDEDSWWAAFFAEIDATPDDQALPADLSTNPKYMEGYGEDGPTLRERYR